MKWPGRLLTGVKSRDGKYFGSKSGTLEAVGLLLPFVTNPEELVGQQVVLEVDNLGVVYGWNKKHCRGDPETSVLLRALHVLEARIACKVHVKHVSRCSTEMAILADKLTRASSTDRWAEERISQADRRVLTGPLMDWLRNPVVDWNLPEKLCKNIGDC